jgi:hypothetical protein
MSTQESPWPEALFQLVQRLRYQRPGYQARLYENLDRGQGCKGLTLVIDAVVPNSYREDQDIQVAHYFPVPAAAYNGRSWMRWLFDRLRDVATHELCEEFAIENPDGQLARPFAPNHSDGNDPYSVRELGTIEDAETSSSGIRRPGTQREVYWP